MRFAVFFRNVNLGRPGSPTAAQLVEAFGAAGASAVASFQAHGNVAFTAPDAEAARTTTAAACARLRAVCALREPAYLRPMARLAALVAADPFADAPREAVYQQCVSFLPEGTPAPALPLVTPRRDVEVFALDGGEAFSMTRKLGTQAGPANAVLERAVGVPATTRSWTTVVRLVGASDEPSEPEPAQ